MPHCHLFATHLMVPVGALAVGVDSFTVSGAHVHVAMSAKVRVRRVTGEEQTHTVEALHFHTGWLRVVPTEGTDVVYSASEVATVIPTVGDPDMHFHG